MDPQWYRSTLNPIPDELHVKLIVDFNCGTPVWQGFKILQLMYSSRWLLVNWMKFATWTRRASDTTNFVEILVSGEFAGFWIL
jgi:hypothetical protein